MNQQNISNLIQMRQNKFIETRTIIETEVDKFLQSLTQLDKNAKERLGVQVYDNATARQIIPSLWVEPFNEEQYTIERNKLDAYIAKVQQACNALNQEALQCLQNLQ